MNWKPLFLLLQEGSEPFSQKSVYGKFLHILKYPFLEYNNWKVSILSLLLFVLALAIASLLSRLIQRILSKGVMSRLTHVDAGLQYTLLRFIHYIIITLGFLYGLKAGFGVDLTSLAVILGFVSVGIGFGLQYIASDIVGGFVLLFERPLRVGDYLNLGDTEGRVSRISFRTTTIITNDHVTIIVPNSELVKNRIINWSYSNPVRIKLPLDVSAESDADETISALIEAATRSKRVLNEPAPTVRFLGYGDSSLKFELLVWIDAPQDHQAIRSELFKEIHRVFSKYSIGSTTIKREFLLRRDPAKK